MTWSSIYLICFQTYDFQVTARVLCLEETEFIVLIDNIVLPSIKNWSTMTTPEIAVTELSDTPKKKKTKNISQKGLEVELYVLEILDIRYTLESKGKGIVGKWG